MIRLGWDRKDPERTRYGGTKGVKEVKGKGGCDGGGTWREKAASWLFGGDRKRKLYCLRLGYNSSAAGAV